MASVKSNLVYNPHNNQVLAYSIKTLLYTVIDLFKLSFVRPTVFKKYFSFVLLGLKIFILLFTPL